MLKLGKEADRLSQVLGWVWRYIWPNRHFRHVNCTIYEWGLGNRPNVSEAVFFGMPVVCVPHGFYIFLNQDFNESVRYRRNHANQWPDWSNRNYCTAYVHQTERHRRLSIDWGVDAHKAFSWGSVRFYPDWARLNLSLLEQYDPKGYRNEQLKIVFFLPHWVYNVDKAAVIKMLVKITENPTFFVVVKGHTRGSGSIDDTTRSELEDRSNVLLDEPAHSPALIQWSDVVINFGSSIGIEAILQDTPVINPQFLHTNKTIFDDPGIAHSAYTVSDVIDLLNRARTEKGSMLPDGQTKRKFILKEVYNSSTEVDILQSYFDRITGLPRVMN